MTSARPSQSARPKKPRTPEGAAASTRGGGLGSLDMGAKPVAPHTSEQFKDYETFRDWLYASFADGASNAERGTSFCDFVIFSASGNR